MNVTNNTIYNGDMAGPPPILENQSNVEGPAVQARQNPFDLSLTPSPRIPATGYTVEVEDPELTKPNLPKRKNLPGHVLEQIVRLSGAKSSVFGSTSRLTQLTKSHALVVQDQKQLDFVNWQIKHGYIDADKLERLDLYFRPQDVQSLPSSLIRLDLNCKGIAFTDLFKIFERLPKLEEINFGPNVGGFDAATFKALSSLSNLKKICFNNRLLLRESASQLAFMSNIIFNENINTLEIRSPTSLPYGWAEALANSNIHTLRLNLSESTKSDCKALLGSNTLGSFFLAIDDGSSGFNDLKKEIENCTIRNLSLVNKEDFKNVGFLDSFDRSNREFGGKKIAFKLDGFSKLEEFKWILAPGLFQYVHIQFDWFFKVDKNFLDPINAYPGRLSVRLAPPFHKDDENNWIAQLAKCPSLHSFSAAHWSRGDYEKFVGHPALTTVGIGPGANYGSGDVRDGYDGLELLATIPSLKNITLWGSTLTEKNIKSLEAIRALKTIKLSEKTLTERTAKAIAALQPHTVDLITHFSLQKSVPELEILLAAKGISSIYFREEDKTLFHNEKLAELLRDSSAGRIQFWSAGIRVPGPELPPPTPTVELDPRLLA